MTSPTPAPDVPTTAALLGRFDAGGRLLDAARTTLLEPAVHPALAARTSTGRDRAPMDWLDLLRRVGLTGVARPAAGRAGVGRGGHGRRTPGRAAGRWRHPVG